MESRLWNPVKVEMAGFKGICNQAADFTISHFFTLINVEGFLNPNSETYIW